MYSGPRPQQALADLRVWKNRKGLMQKALDRHDRAPLRRLLERAAAADAVMKGCAAGRPWDNLENLVLLLARG